MNERSEQGLDFGRRACVQFKGIVLSKIMMVPKRPIGSAACILAIIVAQSILTSCGGGDQAPPATNTTLAGVDANGDGVRDDIESYIDSAYPVAAQTETNKALRQYAKAVQSTIIHADDPVLSQQHIHERFRALECLMARRGTDFHPIFVELRARLLDTTARSNAYLKADDQVKAVDLPVKPMEQWVNQCL